MKVRMLVSISGANGSFGRGEEYTCGDAEAYRLVQRGYAEFLDAETMAIQPKAETTAAPVRKTTRKRRRTK